MFKTHFFDINVENSNIDLIKDKNYKSKISFVGKLNKTLEKFQHPNKQIDHDRLKEQNINLIEEKPPLDPKLQNSLLEGNYTKVSRLMKQFDKEEFLLNSGNEIENGNTTQKWNLIHYLFDNNLDHTINYYRKSLKNSKEKTKHLDSRKLSQNYKYNKSSSIQNFNGLSNIELLKGITKSQHPILYFNNQEVLNRTLQSEYIQSTFGKRCHSLCIDEGLKEGKIKN